MDYLDAKDIIEIHSIAVDETGGMHGVRDLGAVLGIENSPKQAFGGKDVYPTIFDKAAVYACLIIRHHPFLDGNKRTAMISASIFLELNGYKVLVPIWGIEQCALKIIHDKLEIADVSAWFKKHSRKIKKTKK